jgi:hypothetical protein
VAIAARSGPQLRQVAAEDQATVLHLLTKRRQDLVAARTQTINRLHRLLLDLVQGGARRNLTAKRAAALLDQVAPTGAPAVTRWQLAMVQLRRPSAGQVYYRRKLAEGKSPKEALRCLKRRLSDAVYRCLVTDQAERPPEMAPATESIRCGTVGPNRREPA